CDALKAYRVPPGKGTAMTVPNDAIAASAGLEPSGLRSVPVDPVYPKDHYGRISRACYLAAGVLVFLLVFVDLPLAAGFFLLGLLVAGLVTGRLGPTQQVSFDRVHQVIRHGQWGFFCQHGVDEILALQLLRVPPQGTQKAYYQLNLVSS